MCSHALMSKCYELTKTHSYSTKYLPDDTPDSFPKCISHTLFLLETLRNVYRHLLVLCFVIIVILGIRETEDKFYLLVKEQRKYGEARLNCKLRGGSLAMPRTTESNTLLAKYISEADLTHVFIGLQVGEAEVGYMYVDGDPLLNNTSWGLQGPHRDEGSCVQMSNTGAWSQVECGATQFYICEFATTRKTPAIVM